MTPGPATVASPECRQPSAVYRHTIGLVIELFHRRIIAPILRLNDSPHSIALGVALGLWVAFTPTLGLQMAIAVVIGTAIRANRVAAIAMCWVTNVFTAIPIYYSCYVVGLFLLGREGLDYDGMEAVFVGAPDRGLWEAFGEVFDQLGLPLWLGSIAIGTVVAVGTYYPVRAGLIRRRARIESDGIATDENRPQGDGDSAL